MNRPTALAEAGSAMPLPNSPSRLEVAAGWSEVSGDSPLAMALVIDPDPEVGSTAALHMLRQNGVAIDQVASAEAAMEALARRRYRIVILELAAREFDGADLCRRIVERQGPPVLVWSARAAPLDQVAGLELGADDYVAKTAHPLELLARTRGILRRARAGAADTSAADRQLGPDNWLFDPRVNSIRSWNGVRVWLRPASSALLRILCDQPRQQIAREDLLRGVSRGEVEVAARTIDVMVSRLRRSLDACDGGGYLIRTVRPKGYLLDATVQMAEGGTLIRG